MMMMMIIDASTPKPLLSTDEPICPSGQLACANRKCINRDLFCDVCLF